MTATFAERLRRALRDDLRSPPYRLVRYARGLGPIVERDGIEMAVTVQGRLSSSIIGYLSWEDPVSRHLWSRIPREALRGEWMRPIGDEVQFVPPLWHGLLQTAGGTGWLITTSPLTEPGTGTVRHDAEAEAEHERRIAAVVAETLRQLDVVRVPSIEELDAGLRRHVEAAETHPRALALFHAVRGARTTRRTSSGWPPSTTSGKPRASGSGGACAPPSRTRTRSSACADSPCGCATRRWSPPAGP